jgi:hypothetical protein
MVNHEGYIFTITPKLRPTSNKCKVIIQYNGKGYKGYIATGKLLNKIPKYLKGTFCKLNQKDILNIINIFKPKWPPK